MAEAELVDVEVGLSHPVDFTRVLGQLVEEVFVLNGLEADLLEFNVERAVPVLVFVNVIVPVIVPVFVFVIILVPVPVFVIVFVVSGAEVRLFSF